MTSEHRWLCLHHSALTPDEYPLYTSSLSRLSGDGRLRDSNWDRARVSLLDVRGSLRERYGDVVSFDVIDTVSLVSANYYSLQTHDVQILSHFSESPLLSGKMISGGEYFAALRLIQHAKMGKLPSKELVFFQGLFSDSLEIMDLSMYLEVHLSTGRSAPQPPKEPTASTSRVLQQNPESSPRKIPERGSNPVTTANIPPQNPVIPVNPLVSNVDPVPAYPGGSSMLAGSKKATKKSGKGKTPQVLTDRIRSAVDKFNTIFNRLCEYRVDLGRRKFSNASEAERLHQAISRAISQSHEMCGWSRRS
jgi:hypothetical protein